MAAFQQTSMTFGQAKTQIAESISRQNTSEFLLRAGKSLQSAFRKWNKYNWRWLLKQATDYTVAAGDSYIAAPFDLKDVYTLRQESAGRERALTGVPRRLVDRVIRDQASRAEILGYDLATLGRITFPAPADSAGTLRLRFYRRMTLPCSVTGAAADSTSASPIFIVTSAGSAGGATLGSPVAPTTITLNTTFGEGYNHAILIGITDNASGANRDKTQLTLNCTASNSASGTLAFGGDNILLDIPEDYVNGVLAEATHDFLNGTGAPESRLNYWVRRAEKELQDALEANSDGEDEDTAFEIGSQYAYYNPLKTVV